VNEAVEIAHRDGILTSASLMVAGKAAADAVQRARRMPSLRVGLHLVLVEGRPVLPKSAVPDLVDSLGLFGSDMASAGAAMFFSRRARHQLAAEITAQFETFQKTGLDLDHCNAHKHFHLHPLVGSLMLRIGRRFGLNAIRVPREPRKVLQQAEPGTPIPHAWITAPWAHLLLRRVRRAELLAPDQVFGLRWSGAMTKDRLHGLIRALPDGLSEIYLHPATAADFPGAAHNYAYKEELQALIDGQVVAAAREPSIRLGGFGDFLPRTGTSGATLAWT
jgi:hopanoid biosynthesis associated protein HpnK